jgi:hypothetical protein
MGTFLAHLRSTPQAIGLHLAIRGSLLFRNLISPLDLRLEQGSNLWESGDHDQKNFEEVLPMIQEAVTTGAKYGK